MPISKKNCAVSTLKSSTSPISVSLVTTILNKDSTGNYAIIKDGQWVEFTIDSALFPSINTPKGLIVTEGNKSKFESLEDGQIYDIYKYASGTIQLINFLAEKKRCDVTAGYIVYAIHRNTKKVYKFEVMWFG